MRNILWMVLILASARALGQEAMAPLAADGIHDPESPATGVLQAPAKALGPLPKTESGGIDWMRALTRGDIHPRRGVNAGEEMSAVDLDIVMKRTSTMPFVRFRHATHTQWLTCSNCHSDIFVLQKGGNFITMSDILNGEYCGVCHGRVAFKPLACDRCHSVEQQNTGGLR